MSVRQLLRQILTVSPLAIAASSCGYTSQLLGYGALPPATNFALYDAHFATNQAAALANSKLALGSVYFSKFRFIAPAAERQHPHRQLFGHLNWGPFYSPTLPDTLDHPSQLTLYTYLRFYADGRLATYYVSTPPESLVLTEPLDNVGYFTLRGDTVFYELAPRLAPATRLTGYLVLYGDSLRLFPSNSPAQLPPQQQVFYKY